MGFSAGCYSMLNRIDGASIGKSITVSLFLHRRCYDELSWSILAAEFDPAE
jgi:hypothetical protein